MGLDTEPRHALLPAGKSANNGSTAPAAVWPRVSRSRALTKLLLNGCAANPGAPRPKSTCLRAITQHRATCHRGRWGRARLFNIAHAHHISPGLLVSAIRSSEPCKEMPREARRAGEEPDCPLDANHQYDCDQVGINRSRPDIPYFDDRDGGCDAHFSLSINARAAAGARTLAPEIIYMNTFRFSYAGEGPRMVERSSGTPPLPQSWARFAQASSARGG
jgi:hypothetical protein